MYYTAQRSGRTDWTGHPLPFCIISCTALVLLFAVFAPVSATSIVTLSAALPVISSISPSGGPVAGGTVVTVTGSGFTGTSGVSFAGTSAVRFTVIDDRHLSFVTPAMPAGSYPLAITNKAGVGYSSANGILFTYSATAGIQPVAATISSPVSTTGRNTSEIMTVDTTVAGIKDADIAPVIPLTTGLPATTASRSAPPLPIDILLIAVSIGLLVVGGRAGRH